MAHLLLGSLLYEKGQDEEGIAHWEAALKVTDAPILWRNLAFAASQHGDNEKALYYMEQAHLETYDDIDPAFYEEYFKYMLAAGEF